MTRREFAAVAGGLVAGGRAAAELPRRVARPCPLPEAPPYPYRPARELVPATVTALSFVRVDAQSGAVPAAVFQFPQPRLQVDHCFLSRMAVVLTPDGGFTVSYRADQNPQPADDPRAVPVAPFGVTDPRNPLAPGERVRTTLQTNQIARNLFVIRVRGIGASPIADPLPGLAATKPVLADLPVPPVWVERGQPYTGFARGVCLDVRDHYARIDRAEVEFTYR